MATFSRSVLGLSKLTTTSADIYSPSVYMGYPHNVTLFNNHSLAVTVSLAYATSSASFPILEASLASKETLIVSWPNEGLIVPNAGKITGYATTTSMVTCKIDGSEETS